VRHALALAAVLPLALTAQSAGPLTPDGPAMLVDDWHGAQTDEGEQPELTTAFRVTVQPGGRGGTVKLLLLHAGTVSASAPVTLPAEPGTYTFPAPHVLADYREISVGVEQETGAHAIAGQLRCTPEAGEGDICRSQSLDVYPVGSLPDRRLVTQTIPGGSLTIERVTEPDVDGDLAGDESEDRTNLRTTMTNRALSGGRREYAITVENAGPRTADRPQVELQFYPFIGSGRFGHCEDRPARIEPGNVADENAQFCALAPIAAGEKRTVTFVIGDQGSTDAYADVSAEGPDLVGGDEYADNELHLKRPALQLQIRPRPRIGAFSFDVHTRRPGPVTVKLRYRGRTYARRTVHFRRAGGRDVVMRVKRADRETLGGKVVTLAARSRTANTQVKIQPSY
jgi:hypothetical protein